MPETEKVKHPIISVSVPVSVKIVVVFSYAALADVDEMFASAGGFNQNSPI